MWLSTVLSEAVGEPAERTALFAFVSLGVVESVANGLMCASDAVRLFFHADNCLSVRKQLREKAADEIMSHGVQLPDLFESLPAEEAQREFQRELAAMRGLCLKLLAERKLAA